MEEIILESFPFDSMNILNEESSQMEPDREYEAKIFANYFKKFLSNGVYFGEYNNYKENSMKVSLDGGMNIKVAPGAGLIEGVDFENTEERIITLDRPAAGVRLDRIVVQLNNSLDTRATLLYVKQGNGSSPADLQRDSNIYEICIAEVLTSSSSNLIESNINDTRLNKNLCGIVNSLITVDGEELYERFQNYIDTVTDELVRKDQDIVMTGTITDTEGRGLSKNDFTDEYKSKLDNLSNTSVINNLTSTSTTSALSANMGRQLNNIKQNNIKIGSSEPTSSQLSEGDIYLQYFD